MATRYRIIGFDNHLTIGRRAFQAIKKSVQFVVRARGNKFILRALKFEIYPIHHGVAKFFV